MSTMSVMQEVDVEGKCWPDTEVGISHGVPLEDQADCVCSAVFSVDMQFYREMITESK